MPVKKEPIAAIEADPRDPEDRAAGPDEIARGLMGRRIRRLRHRLGLSQAEFARRYGIPVANIRQYEIGRIMPPPAVRAYLSVIAQEPEMAAEALRRSNAA
jgi:putative transcriptional regulator